MKTTIVAAVFFAAGFAAVAPMITSIALAETTKITSATDNLLKANNRASTPLAGSGDGVDASVSGGSKRGLVYTDPNQIHLFPHASI